MNFKKFLIILILFFAENSFYSQNINVDGRERTYTAHLPAGFDKQNKYPLVLVLHGGGGKGKNTNKLTGFDDISDKYGFVTVYPDGIDKQWNDGRNDFHLNPEINDVKFISNLIDTLKILYNIDSNKVYVTGISNGGIMSFRLGCELSDKIAAFAPVAASMPESPAYDCKPARKVPCMIIFGDEDPLVPFEGGEITLPVIGGKRGKVIPVNESVNYWVSFNGCSRTAVESTQNEVSDGTEVVKKLYKSPDGKNDVAFWLVKGGGHTWPGGFAYLPKFIIGKTSREFNASEEIWKFFLDKTLN